MKPILFDKSATTFTSNGLGRLDFISCKVTEERNGIFELEAEIAESALHSSQLEMNSIICAPYYPGGELQAFRVAQITKPISGKYKIYAQHLSYQLTLIPVMPFEVVASASACQTTLNKFVSEAVETCPFTFTTDVTTVSSYRQTVPASIRSRMGGVEGSVIDQFGGEWEYDNYNVYLKNHRGVTTPTVTLRYGKNITDLEQEQNIESTITGIVPYWTDSEGGETVTLPEKSIDSAYAGNYPFKRTTAYDFSSSFEEKPTESQLRTKAQAYVNSSGIGIPVVSIKVSFIDLAQTEEYKDVASLQNVKLCDVINVEFEKYGISTTAKVVKTIYDVLADRYESIEVGSTRTGLTTTISDTNAANIKTIEFKFGQASAETDAKIDDAIDDITQSFPTRQEVQQEIDNATAWITATGGIIRALKNSDDEWTDLLCCSANATASTGNVLRFNVNGIGFSSTGWNGPFTQAWTLDGRMVIGGTNVPSLTVYDNNLNVIFQVDATKMIWNATNSSMDQNGTITANSGAFTDCIIRSNDPNRPNYIKLNEGGISFGTSNVDGANITGSRDTVLIDASDSGYVFPNTTSFGVKTDGDAIIETFSGDATLRAYDGNLTIKTDDSSNDISIESNHDVNISAANRIYAQAPLYVMDKIGADSGSIIVGDDPEIRFYDSMDNYTDNITLEGDCVIMEADEIVVRSSRGAGQYKKGYTGTFNVETSGGGTTTLTFMNGILI